MLKKVTYFGFFFNFISSTNVIVLLLHLLLYIGRFSVFWLLDSVFFLNVSLVVTGFKADKNLYLLFYYFVIFFNYQFHCVAIAYVVIYQSFAVHVFCCLFFFANSLVTVFDAGKNHILCQFLNIFC